MRQLLVFAAALAAAACAGRPTPAAAPAPAAAAPAPRAEATTLRYAVGAGHFKLESQSHVEQEIMGQSTKVDVSTVMLLSVAVADAAGNLGVGITIDSLAVTLPPGVPAPDPAELRAARGKTVRLVTSTQGQTISVVPPDSASAIVQQVTQGFREFLPALPSGTVTAGATWSDTTSQATPTQVGTATVHMTRQHRVLGWEDHGGTRALHVTTTGTYTLTGSGEAQGQSIELTGGGQRTTDAFVSAAGVYLGGTFSDSSLVNANVVSAGMVVPVRSTTHSTLTRLP
jgi:hypothetical protein